MKMRIFINVVTLAVALSACQQPDQSSTSESQKAVASGEGAMHAPAADARSMAASLPANAAPSARGYAEAMDKMSRDMMAVLPSGDADRDFMMMMRSHHQGAIDMAQVERQHGRNDEARATAQKVIMEQLVNHR